MQKDIMSIHKTNYDFNRLGRYRKSETSESVSFGHPDKIADQISDMLLDEYIKRKHDVRVAIETMINGNNVIVGGEVSDHLLSNNDISEIIINLLNNIGYDRDTFDPNEIRIINIINNQSSEIGRSVSGKSLELTAGDQGIMFGYACDENESLMPMPLFLAREIINHAIAIPEYKLGPDAKSQITVTYDKIKPVAMENAIISIQHPRDADPIKLNAILTSTTKECIKKYISIEGDILCNPSGSFVLGGPAADCGLTGRKTAVDSYGCCYLNGGGALSGKDATKVDRSAAYMCRYIAKNIVASGMAKRCGVQLCYAIGISNPVSFSIDTMGTSDVPENIIKDMIKDLCDLSVGGIIDRLKLHRPIYFQTARFGHFGVNKPNLQYSWEECDMALELSKISHTAPMNILAHNEKTFDRK